MSRRPEILRCAGSAASALLLHVAPLALLVASGASASSDRGETPPRWELALESPSLEVVPGNTVRGDLVPGDLVPGDTERNALNPSGPAAAAAPAAPAELAPAIPRSHATAPFRHRGPASRAPVARSLPNGAGDASNFRSALGQPASVGSSELRADRPPRLIAEANPCGSLFPRQAEWDRGVVTLELQVTPAGIATAPRIVAESPAGQGFAEAARRCAARLRFVPARDAASEPVAAASVVRLRFAR